MKKIFILAIFLTSFNQSYSQNALSFDGTNDYVSVPYYSNLNPAIFTVEFWAKVEGGSSSFRSPITSRNGGNFRGYFIYAGENNKWDFILGNGSSWVGMDDGAAVILNTWTHVAASYDGTTMKLYINGVLDQSKISTFAQNSTYPLRIGAGATEGAANYFFNGKLDEVRVWNVARTEAQIKYNMYNRNISATESGLVANYRMNETSGTTVTNSCTNISGLNGTNTNGATIVDSPIQFVGNALNFDGTNDYVSIGTVISSNASFTKEAWIYANSNSNSRNIISSSSSPFWINSPRLSAGLAGNYTLVVDPTDFPTGVWKHVAVTFDDGTNTMQLYVDGILVNSNTTITSSYTAETILIGSHNTGSIFYGSIDEVRIWNVARTITEIANNMNAEIDPTTTGLVAYYTFNTGVASDAGSINAGLTIATDHSGSNNGTLTNFALSGSTSNYVVQKSEIVLLPVELKSFQARQLNGSVILSWITATESANFGFDVERKTTISNWEKIGFVKGNGTSTSEKYYTFKDDGVKRGKYSYRLKQIDRDGTFEYHKTAEVTIGLNPTKIVLDGNYPNPFNSTTVINYQIPKTGNVEIKLFNLLGKEIATIVNEIKEEGFHEVKFNSGSIPSGVYYYKLQSNNQTAIKKMVLMK